MHPFAIAALILAAITPVALFLGCLMAGAQSNTGPVEVAKNIITTRRGLRFHRRHPDAAAAFGQVGYWDFDDISFLWRHGWTPEAIRTAYAYAERALRGFAVRSGRVGFPQPATRNAMWVMSADAVLAFIDQDCPLWLHEPDEAATWVDAAGLLAPLAIRAGLSIAEARAMSVQGRLDAEALSVLVALRGPAGTQVPRPSSQSLVTL
jgi:hypothetical protein